MKIGMAQILVEGGRPAANLRRARAAAVQAAETGCEVVVLPECLDFGWTDPSARDGAQGIPGPSSDALAESARQAGLWLAAGIVEREGERLYNTALLIAPDGAIKHRHRKINELAFACGLYTRGATIGSAETPYGRIGLNVCADNFPDSLELGGALGRMGCRVLLSPCSWAVDGDHDDSVNPYGGMWVESYRKLAVEHSMAVVGVSNVGPITGGPWAGRRCIGRSLAVGPDGEILARLPADEEAFERIEIAEQSSAPTDGLSAVAASRVG